MNADREKMKLHLYWSVLVCIDQKIILDEEIYDSLSGVMLLTRVNFEGDIVVTIKEARVDMAISRKLREELSEILTEKPMILVINLSETQYFDSSALGTLVTILREAKAYGGQVRLANLNQTLITLMKLSKLDAMFKIYESVESALK